MRRGWQSLILALVLSPVTWMAIAADEDRAARQVELDADCEAAREEKLAPLRQQYVEECVAKEQRPDRASCERFYADYGNRSGHRAPLFYDLPECVAAHDHRMEHRDDGD